MKIKASSWRMLTSQDKLFILKAMSQRPHLVKTV